MMSVSNNTARNESDDRANNQDSYYLECQQQDGSASKLDRGALRKLLIASLLCLVFMVGEIVGGWLANSLAIATDAAHLLTDLTSFIISMISICLAARPASHRLNWGWHRAEVLGALVSIVFIWVVTGVLVYMAIQRLIIYDYNIDSSVMLITAAVGLAFNILMGIVLHSGGHGHHGHSHGNNGIHGGTHGNINQASQCDVMPDGINNDISGYGSISTQIFTSENDLVPDDDSLLSAINVDIDAEAHESPGIQRTNINIRAAFIHVLGDILQSVGVLIAAYIIYYKPGWKFVDPICTFFFSILVIFTTFPILRDSVNVLMEGTPRDLLFRDVKSSLELLEGVQNVHGLHIWSLTLDRISLSVHLVLYWLRDRTYHQTMLSNIRGMLKKRFNIDECTIQIEYNSESNPTLQRP